MSLPVSVIIPTLNCREKLERHLESSRHWLPKVGQIIAIDSQSTDGTYELLKQKLTYDNARIISAEKGLYRCWNQGISLALQPYVYISTVGDIITPEGLVQLHQWSENLRLDVMISTPTIVDQTGHHMDKFWPIHLIKETLPSDGTPLVMPSEQLSYATTCFAPSSILGSSASNLYRTDLLKTKPFPEHTGPIGDVIWSIKYLPHLRAALSRTSFSTFTWDGDRTKSWNQQSDELDAMIEAISSCNSDEADPLYFSRLVALNVIQQKRTLCSEISDLRNWLDSIMKSKFNRWKIKHFDSLSVRKLLRTLIANKNK